MKAVEIITGVALVITAVVAYGAVHTDHACFVYPSSATPDWNEHVPGKCNDWEGCLTAFDSSGGAPCSGWFDLDIDHPITTGYVVMSCKVEEKGTAYKCKSLSNAKCNEEYAKDWCLKYRVYGEANCSGKASALWKIDIDKCKTYFPNRLVA